MRTFIITITALLLLTGAPVSAQNLDSLKVSTMTALRVKQLKQSREDLKSRISVEDSKRNSKDDSVSPEVLEIRNMQQDSVCLALRSELVSVELELKELVSGSSVEAVTAIYNSFRHEQGQQENLPVKEDEGGIILSGHKSN